MSAPSYEEMIEALRSSSEVLTYLRNNIDLEEPEDGNVQLIACEYVHAQTLVNLLNDAREKLAAVLGKIDHVPG